MSQYGTRPANFPGRDLLLKVLHVSSGERYGGIEAVLQSLARHRALCPGLEQHFALCFEGRLSAELQALEVPVYMLGNVRLKNPLSIRRARRTLDSVIRSSACDVIICHGPRTMIFFAKTVRGARKPLLMWMHGIRILRRWLNHLLGRNLPDLMICNSSYTQQALASVFPGIESTVIHYPLGTTDTQPGGGSREAIRKATGAREDSVVIVLASRMVSWKGHHVLLDALAQLVSETPWQCWIVGGAQSPAEQEYVDGLESKVVNAGLAEKIRFLGQRTDVAHILSAADIFCQPNLEGEPFGVVYIEAMQAGLPVMTSAIGAAVEIIDETSGVLVPPNNPAALAQALRDLLDDPVLRQRLGGGGPARARQLCDPATCLHELQNLLETAQSPCSE
jgi:glycosyltransferase involved in cell wall biosynthesis